MMIDVNITKKKHNFNASYTSMQTSPLSQQKELAIAPTITTRSTTNFIIISIITKNNLHTKLN